MNRADVSHFEEYWREHYNQFGTSPGFPAAASGISFVLHNTPAPTLPWASTSPSWETIIDEARLETTLKIIINFYLQQRESIHLGQICDKS